MTILKTNSLNYYIINVEENKEFLVKKSLSLFFPEMPVIIPIEKLKVKIDGKNIFYFNKQLPDYVIFGTKELTQSIIDKVNSIEGVLFIISENTNKGDVPSRMSDNEVKRFLPKESFQMKDILSGDVHVISGQYAGSTGAIKKEYKDGDNEVLVSIKGKRVKISIWQIGKEL